MTSPPASEPEPAYEVKVDGNSILIKKQGKSSKCSSPQIELTLLEKDKVEGTDVASFKFSKQNNDDQGVGGGPEVDHGLRKWFKTRCEIAGMKSINIEKKMGHSVGISDSYYRERRMNF